MEQIKAHVAKNGIMYIPAFIAATVSMFANVGFFYEAWDQKADKEFVAQSIEASRAEIQSQMAGIEGTLNRVLAGQIAGEIDRLLAMRCRGPNNRDLDETIRRLKEEYRRVTQYEYVSPTCKELGIAG